MSCVLYMGKSVMEAMVGVCWLGEFRYEVVGYIDPRPDRGVHHGELAMVDF